MLQVFPPICHGKREERLWRIWVEMSVYAFFECVWRIGGTDREASCYDHVFGWFQLFDVTRVLYALDPAPGGQGRRPVQRRARVNIETVC